MYNFKTLRCYNCDSVVLNLPEKEISKLNGLHFVCECCGHQNLLVNSKFTRSGDDPYPDSFWLESLEAV